MEKIGRPQEHTDDQIFEALKRNNFIVKHAAQELEKTESGIHFRLAKSAELKTRYLLQKAIFNVNKK